MKTMVTPPEYPDLKIKKIVTDEGDALDDFIYNPCATLLLCYAEMSAAILQEFTRLLQPA